MNTSLSIVEVMGIISIHWFSDFLLQDGKWAVGKSKNFKSLISHTFVYSYSWMIIGSILKGLGLISLSPGYLSLFCLITFVTHTITDYFTSKVTSKMFKEGKLGSSIPNWGAFTVIGIDQVLHYAQLFITYLGIEK